jgi:hypothetical protein
MKKNKKTTVSVNKGLNKMVYQGNEVPEGGVKLPIQSLATLVDEGEKLAVMLTEQMVSYGNSYHGSFIRTYALTQMVAYLKVFAADSGFDIMPMFETLMPSFTKEAQQMLEEIKAERRQQQTGYKFLDLDNEADAKEFKAML